MKINILTIIILIIYSYQISAQVFDNSQAHSRVKWKQIRAEKFDLIFPEEFSSRAPQLANELDHFLMVMNKDFKKPVRRIPFVVQSDYLIPNGFVMLAPRKSELYPTPSGIADNQEWLPNLALHESRHVVQFDNLTGKIQGAFFQQLALALFALHLPAWYFEGDATLQETLHSNGGRGRLASWNMPLRTNLLSHRDYNFHKYIHGSYKDIVPSYYTIGYFMNSELYEIDSLIHPKLMDEMSRKLLRPFNFNQALKKHTGITSRQLFAQTIRNLQTKWNADTSIFVKKHTDRYPTNYLLPQLVNDKLYVLKESRQRTPAIVAMDSTLNGEHRIVETGRQIMPYFHVRDHLIVWDEYRRDPRFQKQSYNIVNIHNLHTGKTHTLTSKTRYYTPILSPDLSTIACIEVDSQQQSRLVLLNTTNGEAYKSIQLPTNMHIQQPYFHSSGNRMVAIGATNQGTQLLEIDLISQEINDLTPASNVQFERPIYDGDAVLYKANYHDKDQIFRLEGGVVSQLTNSTFGAFNPFVIGDVLWFNDYQVDGYKIQQQPKKSIHSRIADINKIQTLYPAQNNFTPTRPFSSGDEYLVEDYKVTANSFNFHSLTLSGNDFESFDNFRPGIFWLSNDILNTTQAKLGYEYDTELQKSVYSASLTYQRFFPKISLHYTNRGQIGQATRNDNSKISFDWREHHLSAEVQLPFTIYRRDYTYSYGFNAGTSLLRRYNISLPGLQNFDNSIDFPLSYQAYLHRNKNLSTMDLSPRWGQNISVTYRHIPFDEGQTGSTWSLRTNFYFPGIWLNHGVQVRFALQEKSGRYIYHDDIPLPRGYTYYPTQLLRNTLLLDYRFPLAYPDWSLGQLAYIKRIRADITADYQNIHETADMQPQTAGFGLSLDFNLFKYPLPLFSVTGRLNYINTPQATQRLVPTFSFGYSY